MTQRIYLELTGAAPEPVGFAHSECAVPDEIDGYGAIAESGGEEPHGYDLCLVCGEDF